MIMQAPSLEIGSSPTSVHQDLMSELDRNKPQTHQSEKEVISATTTIYRRSTQESSLSASGPLFYENDDKEMKRPPIDRTSSIQVPPQYAEAEKEKIFCLKRECKALKMAIRAMPKHSKEWTMMSARLDIAKDELEATLEDMNMTHHFAQEEAIEVGEGAASQFVPTPPLSSPLVQKTPIKSFSTLSSHGSETDSSTEINEVRQKAKSKVNVDALKQEMDKAEKFSLEYFKIKKKLDKATNVTSLDHSNSSNGSLSSTSVSTLPPGPPLNLQSSESTTFEDIPSPILSVETFDTSSTGPPQSLKSFDGTPSPAPQIRKSLEVRASRRAIPPPPQLAIPEKSQAPLQPIGTIATPSHVTTQQQSIKLGNGLGDLKELLDVVPKYSLEWFKLKNEIKEASGGGQQNNTPKRPTRQLSKQRSSITIGAKNNDVAIKQNQFNRLDSSDNQYPIPHVTKSRNAERRKSSSVRPTSNCARSKGSTRTRAFSKERSKEGSRHISSGSLDAQYFYVRMRKNVVTVQSIWRGRVAHLNFMRFKSAALCIQSTFRMTLRRNLYKQVLYGLIFIQACWRGHVQRLNTMPVQKIVLQPIAQDTNAVHKPAATNTISSDEDDFSRIQRSIEAMKNEKMSMEQKVLQLKNDIEVIKNEKLRKQLDHMKQEIESLEHHNEDVLHEHTATSSVLSSDQTLASVPTNTYSVVLEQKGPLGIEMEHHKTSDTVRVAYIKKRSQADKAGLCQGDIVVNFRSRKYPDGMNYAQFIALAKQGVRPLVLDITRVDPSVVGSSRRSGFFRKKKMLR